MPHLAEGCQAGKGSFSCSTVRMAPEGQAPALALLGSPPLFLAAVFRLLGSWRGSGGDGGALLPMMWEDAVQAIHGDRHCRQGSDGQEGEGCSLQPSA